MGRSSIGRAIARPVFDAVSRRHWNLAPPRHLRGWDAARTREVPVAAT